MKKPRTIKAIAVVNKEKPKLDAMQIFDTNMKKEIILDKTEVLCEIEIVFSKYIK
jgi:hypothetical protein